MEKSKPAITSPSPGSELSGSSETFTWTDNGTAVSAWGLEVGSSIGSADIFCDGGTCGPAHDQLTSMDVSGLPCDGSTVYVRLWYKTGGWEYLDYQYTASSSCIKLDEHDADIKAKLDKIPPTWSQKLQCDDTACPRFELVMGDEAVIDKETGLVWEQSPSEIPQNWAGAKWYCYDKRVGNRKGWRLPTAEELASLVDTTQQALCLPSGHPFNNVQLSHYWTITSEVSNTAYIVHFSSGVVNAFPKSDVYNVWCVRGGHGYNAY